VLQRIDALGVGLDGDVRKLQFPDSEFLFLGDMPLDEYDGTLAVSLAHQSGHIFDTHAERG